jgi:Ca2+-binding EF-hand superfamily protein
MYLCVDNTGTIDFQEFAGLWKYIEDWKRCFQTFDVDHSGSIDRAEMKNALQTFGYNLSDRFVTVLIQKFDKYGKLGKTYHDGGTHTLFRCRWARKCDV